MSVCQYFLIFTECFVEMYNIYYQIINDSLSVYKLNFTILIPGEITRLMDTKIQLYKITFMKIDFLLVRSVRTPLAIETALRQRACI